MKLGKHDAISYEALQLSLEDDMSHSELQTYETLAMYAKISAREIDVLMMPL